MDEYLKVACVFQIRFSPEIAGKQHNVPTLSLSITKKASGDRRPGGVVVVVTGCGKASGGFHHIRYGRKCVCVMRMRMYAREYDFSNKCRAFNGFLRVCVRKDMSLLLLLLE